MGREKHSRILTQPPPPDRELILTEYLLWVGPVATMPGSISGSPVKKTKETPGIFKRLVILRK